MINSVRRVFTQKALICILDSGSLQYINLSETVIASSETKTYFTVVKNIFTPGGENICVVSMQDYERVDAELVAGESGRHVELHPGEEDGRGHHPLGGGPHVDPLPVRHQRGAPQDPHRDAHHHLQENIRQHGHAVEVRTCST